MCVLTDVTSLINGRTVLHVERIVVTTSLHATIAEISVLVDVESVLAVCAVKISNDVREVVVDFLCDGDIASDDIAFFERADCLCDLSFLHVDVGNTTVHRVSDWKGSN